MAIGFNLKYGDGYEDLPQWDLFVKVLKSARGRKNMFIFRVITALINELDLNDADGFQALNAIEYWASGRLSSKPLSHNMSLIPKKSPPPVSPVSAKSDLTEPVSSSTDRNEHTEHPYDTTSTKSPVQEQGNLFCGYDISAFRIT